MKKLIKKYQYGKPVERQDKTNTTSKSSKRNINKEQYHYYTNLINKAFPVTFEDFREQLINAGILPTRGEYTVPVGHLGDGYQSVVVTPEVQYGPYDLPEINVEGWGITQDPEYSDKEWRDLARKTVQNDTTLSLGDASRYMWALDNPEFNVHPLLRHMSIPVQPGPWNRKLVTNTYYQGYLPSDNPEYGGNGDITYGYEEPRTQIYKTNKYPPEDYNNKKHLYFWLDRFYNRKNGLNKPSNPFTTLSK